MTASQRGSAPSFSFTRVTIVIMGAPLARGECKFNARDRGRRARAAAAAAGVLPALAVDELRERQTATCDRGRRRRACRVDVAEADHAVDVDAARDAEQPCDVALRQMRG